MRRARQFVRDRVVSIGLTWFPVLLVLTSCSGSEKDWQVAVSSNSVDAYRNYLLAHPDSTDPHRDDALERIEDLIWEAACTEEDTSSFAEYLLEYPQGRYSEQLLDSLTSETHESVMRLLADGFTSQVRSMDSIQGVDSLVQAFEKYEFVVEGLARLERLLTREIRLHGPGDRFVIKHVKPDGGSGSVTLCSKDAEWPNREGALVYSGQFLVVLRLEFPGDGFTMGYAFPSPEVPWGDGSIHRYFGPVKHSWPTGYGLMFESNSNRGNRLTFAVIEGIGYVHLRGSGSVKEFHLVSQDGNTYIQYGAAYTLD